MSWRSECMGGENWSLVENTGLVAKLQKISGYPVREKFKFQVPRKKCQR
jgi:hypothetical protein